MLTDYIDMIYRSFKTSYIFIFEHFWLDLFYLDYALPGQVGFQFPANNIARGLIDLHNHIMFILVFIFFFTLSMLFFTLNTFSINSQNYLDVFNKVNQHYNIKIFHNTIVETCWIIVPSLILLSIAVPSFALLYGMEIRYDQLMAMHITAHQWYWTYDFVLFLESQIPSLYQDYSLNNSMYPIIPKVAKFGFDSYMVPTTELEKNDLRLLKTTNPVVLPIETNIKAIITSDDVIHSWAVPALGIKIDAAPGRLNEVNLFIDRVGHFYGQCSELCGVNHGFMPIEIYGITKLQYITYLTMYSPEFRNYHMDVWLWLLTAYYREVKHVSEFYMDKFVYITMNKYILKMLLKIELGKIGEINFNDESR